MRKIYIKIMAFICVAVCFLSYIEPLSVKVVYADSEHEVKYIFKTEAGVSIAHKVFQIYDCLHWSPSF